MSFIYSAVFCLLISLFAAPIFSLSDIISKTELIVDKKLAAHNKVAMENYLNRYKGESANEVNRQGAQNFLKDLFFIAKARCQLHENEGENTLTCEVKPKYLIRAITIHNLSAVLLSSELQRKLPMQVGQLIAYNEKNIQESSNQIKNRIETFLRKNGFYGGIVSVDIKKDEDELSLEINATIEKGDFARVNSVSVMGDSPISPYAVRRIYGRMCLSFNRIFEAIALWTSSCYSKELMREATLRLQNRLAKMGYIKANVRVKHNWIDPHDKNAPKRCQKDDPEDMAPRCVDLKIDINKGPHVRWKIVMKEGEMVRRNAFLRLLSSIFIVDQLSRVTSRADDLKSSDRLIIEQELEKCINFIDAKNLDEQELSISVNQMQDYLAKKGYTNAKVVPSVIIEDKNNILVEFHIYAGKAFSIKNVTINPSPFSLLMKKDQLADLVKVRSFSSPGNISFPEVDEALNKVIEQAYNSGYNDAKGKSVISVFDPGDVQVDFYLEGSKRETINQIIIKNGYEEINNKIIPLLKNCDEFQSGSCTGSSLIRNSIANDKERIASFYQSEDFFYAKVRSEVVKNGEGYDLIFHLYDERFGEYSDVALYRQIIKDIIVSGNSSIRTDVIKRLFSKKSLDSYSSLDLKKGISNLRESGLFTRIDHKILAAQENSDDAFFIVQLVERPSLNFDLGFSLSTDQLLSLEAEVEENNFLSSMLTLKSKLALGFFWGRQSSISNKFIWPFIWGKPFSFTLHAPMIIYDDKLHRKKPFRRLQSRIVAGIDWRASANLLPYIKYSFVYNKERSYEHGNIPRESFEEKIHTLDGLIPLLKRRAGEIAGVLKPGISYVNLDNPFDPHSGFDLNNWVELSGSILQGKPPFINIGSQNRLFIPIKECTLALQATFMRAFIEPNAYNFSHLKNFSSMDKLGGDRSVRGYEDGFLGIETMKEKSRLLSGYFSNVANIEFRFPLGERSSLGRLSGALFVDQGMLIPCSDLWRCQERSIKKLIDDKGFGISAGAGLRYIFPVGPISIDYGISLVHRNEHKIHFQFGYAF